MLFNSLDFAIFLPTVFGCYWFVLRHNLKWQNAGVVLASYVFYAWWDWRFLTLIMFSTLVDYLLALQLKRVLRKPQRKLLLGISIGVNLGLLGFFKYYDFFVDNFVQAFTWFGQDIQPNSLNIILPVGISFYTFQTLSYTMDVYRKKLEPTKDLVAFAAFVSFFPQLVAGPIERATNLLPQFYIKRKFNYDQAVNGLRQMLWGFFKKVVIADNCAQFVNIIFDGHQDYTASTLLMGAVFFAFQIYGDFSGYSDIAIGTARLFGFNLMQNFATPYFSRDIAEFWHRWHISLSTWFRDYLYIPLGGSRGAKTKGIRNVFIVFLVSGFWHGANWTFIVWGALNALFFLPLFWLNKNRKHTNTVAENKNWPSGIELGQMGLTFLLTCIAWVVFRAANIKEAITYFKGMVDWSIVTIPQVRPTFLIVLIMGFILMEWWGRNQQYAIEKMALKSPRIWRWLIYYVIVMLIFLYGAKEQEFIYFQF